MKLADLCRAGRAPELPLRLQLPAGELQLHEWLRVLPGRRYVGRGEWQGQQVLAKLLVGSHARRHYYREDHGAKWLAAQGITTPQLLATAFFRGIGGWLLFDYLEDAASLGDQWRAMKGAPPLSPMQAQLLKAVLVALGHMHATGLWQEDLHLDNVLCHNDQLFWVDGGSVRHTERFRPLSPRLVVGNLGVFFAQLPAKFDPFIGDLLKDYQRCNPVAVSLPELQRRVDGIRRWRLASFLGKITRDCTLFVVNKGASGLRAIRREEVTLLEPLLADPDRFIAAGESLKDGRSSTVVRMSLKTRSVVVKRYNIKGLSHWLRRFWRPSRAMHSWREGHRLAFLGIATATPLGMLEQRTLWLRRQGYLVTEDLKGDNIRTRFKLYENGALPVAEISALEGLFAALIRERISHGDMKGSNLIWKDGEWALIDLDAVYQHRTRRGFARAFSRDRARFLKNWPVDSPLYRLLDERIPQLSSISKEQRG